MPTRRTWLSRVIGVTLLLCAAHFPTQTTAQPSIAFDRDIRPILEGKCVSCHGGALQLSKLDLRTRETALSGGARGAVLVPGNAERSRLYRMVAGLEQPAMPMQGTPLDGSQLALLKQWIDEGARWDGAVDAPAAAGNSVLTTRPLTPEERAYWAFKLPEQAPVPQVDRKDFTHPIDRFLEKARAQHKLTAAPRADRLTLVRRAYLDLLGLPPSPAEVAAFIADDTAGRLGAADRQAARLAALRRAVGAALARRGALCRFGGLRVRHASAERLALPRLRDPLVQRRQALRRLPERADRRRRAGRQDRGQPDRHRLPARRARGCCSGRRTTPSAASIISTRFSARSARARWG